MQRRQGEGKPESRKITTSSTGLLSHGIIVRRKRRNLSVDHTPERSPGRPANSARGPAPGPTEHVAPAPNLLAEGLHRGWLVGDFLLSADLKIQRLLAPFGKKKSA